MPHNMFSPPGKAASGLPYSQLSTGWRGVEDTPDLSYLEFSGAAPIGCTGVGGLYKLSSQTGPTR